MASLGVGSEQVPERATLDLLGVWAALDTLLVTCAAAGECWPREFNEPSLGGLFFARIENVS